MRLKNTHKTKNIIRRSHFLKSMADERGVDDNERTICGGNPADSWAGGD